MLRQHITKLPPLSPGLRTLWIGECDVATLDGLERHPTLQRLWLTNVPKLDLARVLERCAELPELTELRLGGPFPALPRAIAKLPSLLAVELEDTTALDVRAAFAALGASPTLRTLRIRGIAKLPEALAKPPDALAPLAGLHELQLMHVGGTLPALGALRALVTLDLAECTFTSVPPTIGALAALEVLCLRRTPIAALPDEICACSRLRTLDLDDTNIKALPAQLGRLANLRALRARTKQLRTLPASIGDLAELRELTVPWRKLTVPESIYRLRLETFSGPPEIEAKLTMRPPPTPQVDRLALSDADRLPADFGDPRELRLYVPAHAGPLPQLDACRRLQDVAIDTGDLGDAFTRLSRLPALRRVCVEGDHATLPDALGALAQITELEIECPPLVRLPAAIRGLASLEQLVVRSHVTFPDELGALASLRVLDARASTLPATVGKLKQLARLDLGVGDAGRLPAAIRTCTALANVTISAMSSRVDGLAHLAKLPALRVLVLRHVEGAEALVEALAGTQLQELALHGKLAALPPAIGKLAALEKLALADTGLAELPAALRACSALRWISLPSTLARAPDLKARLPPGRWKKHFRSHVTWYERGDAIT